MAKRLNEKSTCHTKNINYINNTITWFIRKKIIIDDTDLKNSSAILIHSGGCWRQLWLAGRKCRRSCQFVSTSFLAFYFTAIANDYWMFVSNLFISIPHTILLFVSRFPPKINRSNCPVVWVSDFFYWNAFCSVAYVCFVRCSVPFQMMYCT